MLWWAAEAEVRRVRRPQRARQKMSSSVSSWLVALPLRQELLWLAPNTRGSAGTQLHVLLASIQNCRMVFVTQLLSFSRGAHMPSPTRPCVIYLAASPSFLSALWNTKHGFRYWSNRSVGKSSGCSCPSLWDCCPIARISVLHGGCPPGWAVREAKARLYRQWCLLNLCQMSVSHTGCTNTAAFS